MSENTAATGELDRLLNALESIIEPGDSNSGAAIIPTSEQTPRETARLRETSAGDAIDTVLATPARTTAVHSLRSAPEIEAFRQALTDGLIRADTVNQLLRLVNEIVGQLIR